MSIATENIPHTEDLLIGILAVLAINGRDTLKTTDKVFHSAFGEALNEFRKAGGTLKELADSYYQDVVSKTYDELNHALITAESYSLLRFPNPSYSRLQITMNRRVAERLLEKHESERSVFERAAQVLLERMAHTTG